MKLIARAPLILLLSTLCLAQSSDRLLLKIASKDQPSGPVTVEIVVTNISKDDITLIHDDLSQGELTFSIDVRDVGEKKPNHTHYGRVALDQEEMMTSHVSITTLKPKKSLTFTCNLSRLVAMEQGATYKVRVGFFDPDTKKVLKSNLLILKAP